MLAKNVKIGTRIKTDTYDKSVVKATVIGNQLSEGGAIVAVEWDDGLLEKVDINNYRIIDSELESVYHQIQEKLSAASLAIEEANDLAKKHNFSLSDIYDEEIGRWDLMSALQAAGWSTSSMSC